MPKPYQVFVTDYIADDLSGERQILGEIAEITALGARTEGELFGKVEAADALLVFHDIIITQALIERLTQCRLIVRCGVGYDNVDVDAARRCNIDVANVPDYGTEDVADTALGLTLSLARGIQFCNSRLRAGAELWNHHLVAPLHRLRGQVFGVVGLGRIGTAVAIRAKAFGFDVVFFDPYKPDGYDKSLGIRRAESLGALLAQSQILSLHCPQTAETEGMIDAAALAGLPTGAILVNTARGGVVDTAAVADAIASGQLSGAGIDVLVEEPPRDDEPLVAAWRDPRHPAHHRVILNPHTAFYTEEGLHEMRTKAAKICRVALSGERPRNVVN